jgi:hypothetical protein
VLPDCPCSHIGSWSWEGPWVSRRVAGTAFKRWSPDMGIEELPDVENPPRLHTLVYRRCRTCSAFDRWLGAQGVFDPIEMAATMHRTPQDTRLPTPLNLRHHLR